jgi:hypothetical protein
MSNFWKRFAERLFARPAQPNVPPPPPPMPPTPAPIPPPQGYPNTYTAAVAPGGVRADFFDPALKQFPRALRPGDPAFANPGDALRWVSLRRRATDRVLRGIAESSLGDGLILRGSRLLRAWFGDSAREPGDLDWVVDPPPASLEEPGAGLMTDWLVRAALAAPAVDGVAFDPGAVAVDDIWTYERAAGRRVVFPWRAAGLPGGAVQVDVVFGEGLVEPDRRVPVPLADGGCACVRAAGPAQSLAWKLLWLSTDWYPQGKDLYDAVLLAERFALPAGVLEETLRQGDADPMPANAHAFVEGWRLDWDTFRREYPWAATGDVRQWLARLAEALGPTFAEHSGVGEPVELPARGFVGHAFPAAMRQEWLTSEVVALARSIDAEGAFDGLPILADALQEAGCDHSAMLEHCRACGPHTRGCWVVDLVLEK